MRHSHLAASTRESSHCCHAFPDLEVEVVLSLVIEEHSNQLLTGRAPQLQRHMETASIHTVHDTYHRHLTQPRQSLVDQLVTLGDVDRDRSSDRGSAPGS